MHSNKILHRCLSPLNIFMVDGVPKLADLNICKDITSQVNLEEDEIQTIVVTQCSYLDAPEISSGKYGFFVDTYSLGMIFALLLFRNILPIWVDMHNKE